MAHAPASLTGRQRQRFRDGFGGDIVTPADADYDDARRLWNAVHDRRPAVITRPRTTDDVASAIRLAREHDLELAVRSGAHSIAGHSGCDGGVVIDMALMRGVSVDSERRVARVNGGALLGELDVAAQSHGLVCPVGVVGHTGVAGLTLGGGIGRLQRRFGLTIDSLRAVELVTADGRVIRASETEEPDLFWGMRGAGWNFGVVTAFEFALHPFGPHLNRGVRVYSAGAAQEVWQVFRHFAAQAPDSVSMIFGIGHAEPEAGSTDSANVSDPIVVVSFNHSGPADQVEHDTVGLRLGPEPLFVRGGSEPYLDVQTAHDLSFAAGHRSYVAGLFANDFRPEAIDSVVDQVASGPSSGDFSVTALGGAIARVDDDAMAFTGRAARFDLSVDVTWDDPADDDANRTWARRTMSYVEPDAIEGRYANEAPDVGPAEAVAIYGPATVAHLAALKRTWDPDNIFHLNQNVAPAPE